MMIQYPCPLHTSSPSLPPLPSPKHCLCKHVSYLFSLHFFFASINIGSGRTGLLLLLLLLLLQNVSTVLYKILVTLFLTQDSMSQKLEYCPG